MCLSDRAGKAEVALEAEATADAAAAAAVTEICRAVGLELDAGGSDVPEEVLALAQQRDRARADRDFATADAIRDALVADGWVVEDTAAGTQVRPA